VTLHYLLSSPPKQTNKQHKPTKHNKPPFPLHLTTQHHTPLSIPQLQPHPALQIAFPYHTHNKTSKPEIKPKIKTEIEKRKPHTCLKAKSPSQSRPA